MTASWIRNQLCATVGLVLLTACLGASFVVGQNATAPSLSLLAPPANSAALCLRWDNLGVAFAYTVEVRDTLAPGHWLPAPASVWPVSDTQWSEPRLATGGAEFYRLSVSPAASERGRLLSATLLRSFSVMDIQAIYRETGVPPLLGGPVRAYAVTYQTRNPFNLATVASGLLAVPDNATNPLPLVSYQHGTMVSRSEVPSALKGLETVIGIALASGGYVAALPDYVGLGISPGLHPFLHAKSEAAAAIDLLRAVRTFCATNAIVLNDQLFLMGYSQGGHATLAMHREIETFYTNEFAITASAPMAGPYDLSGSTTADFLSDRPMPNPYYFLYLLAAYQSIYHVAGSLAEMLVSPYDVTLPPLLDGQHNSADLNAAIGTSSPKRLLKPEFLNDSMLNPNHPLRLALRDNDLIDWTPAAPMKLYHCQADQDVVFANTQVAYDSFTRRGATQVELVDPLPQAGHGDCALISLAAARFWFDSLVKR